MAKPSFENCQRIEPVLGYLALPEGSTFISVEHFGTSAWTVTGRVVAQNPDGTQSDYFLKVSSHMSQIYSDMRFTYYGFTGRFR